MSGSRLQQSVGHESAATFAVTCGAGVLWYRRAQVLWCQLAGVWRRRDICMVKDQGGAADEYRQARLSGWL